MDNIKIFRLKEVADWQLSIPDKEKPFMQIPSLQRGLVWNATQAEVLWDSLMRGIPIGTFSLIPAQKITNQKKSDSNLPEDWDYQNTFWLLDGQQRANTITMGYRNFEDNTMPLLWLDLQPNNINGSNRRFFFRVTTLAHPWGYKISDAGKENKNTIFAAYEQKDACKTLSNSISGLGNIRKPKPFELWPHKAILPIPFFILTNLYPNITQKEIISAVNKNEILKNSNWWQHFKTKFENEIDLDLENIKLGLDRVNKTHIAATVAPDDLTNDYSNSDDGDNTEIATYFLRMNKSGVEPSAEDINYSILKSVAPVLSHIDILAKGKMSAARLANLSMLVFASIQDQKWHSTISRKKVYELAGNSAYISYIENDFEKLLGQVDKWLKEGALLPIHKTHIAHKYNEVFQLLLLLAQRCFVIDSKIITALATLSSWFGKTSARYIYEAIIKNGNSIDAIKYGLYTAIRDGLLVIPPKLDDFIQIQPSGDDPGKILETALKYMTHPCRVTAIEQVRPWNSDTGRDLLLFSCKEFMQEIFSDFDPAQCAYSEENRPWDYDHIFPQSWLIYGQGRPQGHYHRVIEKYIHSIGNIAPLPFQLNRGKNDSPPKEYCGVYYNTQLMVEVQEPFFSSNNSGVFEYNAEKGLKFVATTANRLYQLYRTWYEELNIADLLNFSNINDDPRKMLFEQIIAQFSGSKAYYNCAGFQYECLCSTDWARPWLSVGIVRDNPRKDFICISSNGKIVEFGIRRHPEENSIENDSNKWWHSDYKQYSLQNLNVEQIIRELKNLHGWNKDE